MSANYNYTLKMTPEMKKAIEKALIKGLYKDKADFFRDSIRRNLERLDIKLE
ncbi:MAG: hypothetical protein J7L47_05650 [Candidatus Odinarchaeota archaeon]|nr:hypothetical protein [Candidatus Odinarchaeota archaeon]